MNRISAADGKEIIGLVVERRTPKSFWTSMCNVKISYLLTNTKVTIVWYAAVWPWHRISVQHDPKFLINGLESFGSWTKKRPFKHHGICRNNFRFTRESWNFETIVGTNPLSSHLFHLCRSSFQLLLEESDSPSDSASQREKRPLSGRSKIQRNAPDRRESLEFVIA